MTNQAIILLWISSVLIACFFIAIVGTSLYSYVSKLIFQKIDKELNTLISGYFHASLEKRQPFVEQLNQYTKRSTLKKERMINYIIQYCKDYIDNHNDQVVHLCEEADLKAYLIKRLSSKRDYIQALACRQLGDLRLNSTEAYICKLMDSKDNNVIYNVLLALAKMGDLENLSRILVTHSRDINISFRAIIEVLGEFRGSKEQLFKETIDSCDDYLRGIFIKAAVDGQYESLSSYYVKYLISDNLNLKIACLRALSELQNPVYEHNVIQMLDAEEWEVRAAAAKGLEKVGTSDSFGPLLKMTSDPEWWVRHNAASALVSIPGGKEYAQQIFRSDDQYAREAVADALRTAVADADAIQAAV